MKVFLVLALIVLSACSDLSETESKLVGYWEWNLISNQFKESGFLELRADRTYAYRIESINPTEQLVENTPHDSKSYWRVKEGSVCLASEWSGGSFFDKVEATKERCIWHVSSNAKNNVYLEIDGGFINDKVEVFRNPDK